MSPLMLSVSGCRGVVGESLTPEVVSRFAAAYGSWLRDRAGTKRVRVVLGRDGRAGCGMVHAAATAGLLGSGCEITDVGVAMTPTTAVMTDFYAAEGGNSTSEYVAGMVLTASHNPQQWNGLKCLLAEGGEFGSAACAPPAASAEEIIARFRAAAGGNAGLYTGWSEVGERIEDHSGTEAHVDRLMRALEESGLTDMASHLGHGVRVAVDSVNGSGSGGARLLLESLGCDEILHLHADDTGRFPHPPEPTKDNLSQPGGLRDAVVNAGCDVGFAQDPDADRLAIVDELGGYIGEEYTLALGAMALLSSSREDDRSPVLVTNLSTSRMLDDVAATFGGRVLRTPVGEANVVEVMKKEKALAGGEGNGGVIWPRVAYVRDSLTAMALTIYLLSPHGAGKGAKRALSRLVASCPAYAIHKRKVDLARRDDASPAVAAIAAAYKDHRVDLQDGVRVDFRDKAAWLHVRASNTEPIMRLIAEAPTDDAAAMILDEAARVIAG
ncbi:MAG: phosphoglucosamine mutase [Phycisphaerae bacterium]|nr:phosphoglucosamine mutase [Phycisphaerae bacterium]